MQLNHAKSPSSGVSPLRAHDGFMSKSVSKKSVAAVASFVTRVVFVLADCEVVLQCLD